MWRERIATLIHQDARHVVFKGGDAYGVDVILAFLAERERVAWVWLEPPDTLDDVSLGNALASAINRALGSVFLSMALPYTYHLEVLKSHLVMLTGLSLAVSHAQDAPQFCEALLRLPTEQCRVLLDWQSAPPTVSDKALVVTTSELMLRREEAVREVPEVKEDVVTSVWYATGGAYAEFQKGIYRLTGHGLSRLPSARGWTRRHAGDERLVDPAIFLEVLMSQERYIEALDVACREVPDRVHAVVPFAGPVYQERCLNLRLFLLLRSLDDVFLDDEAILEWLRWVR